LVGVKTRSKSALRKLIYILDTLVLLMAFAVAFEMHGALREILPFFKSPPKLELYVRVAVFSIPVWVLLVPLFRLHLVFERVWSFGEMLVQLIKHHLAGFTVLTVMLFVTQIVFNRSLILLFMVCSFTLMLTTRLLLGIRQWYAWKSGDLTPRIILAGEPSTAMDRFLKDISFEEIPPQVLGRVAKAPSELEREARLSSADMPLMGELEDLDRVLHDTHADQVLFYPPYHTPGAAAPGLRACETVGVKARLAIDTSHPGAALPRVVNLAGHPFITFDVLPPRPELRAIKHGFDAVAAALGLVVLLPLFAVVSLSILITMGRPVLFLQKRAGRHGRTFRMIKFRTMIPGAEMQRAGLEDKNEMDGPVFKVTDDPRVTRLGHFLRRTSIDELPQLVNVLRGTMSLVGPRPLPIEEQQEIYGWHRRRLSVKPGITGIWQVSGRSNIDFEQWMKLDLQYVDKWSLWLDLKILMKTIPAVLFKIGAK
jgi:exopolysaccharide biosynthesis polyprenyl glycosylphosphotransferase